MGAEINVSVVTFNTAERAAVQQILDEMCDNSHWSRRGMSIVWPDVRDATHEVLHEDLNAQGNVTALAELATLYTDVDRKPDAVIFFGCAGAADPSERERVFIAAQAHYCSLGHVRPAASGNAELVELKSKWITDQPNEPGPLAAVPLGTLADQLPELVGVPRAIVAAVDKVIEVATSAVVPQLAPGLAPAWSYADAIAHVRHVHGHSRSTIVDMESFGIGRAISFLRGLEERVLVIRVTTDDLVSKNTIPGQPSQEDLLMDARYIVADVLAALLLRAHD